MPFESWYAAISDTDELYQGDILSSCCVPILLSDLPLKPEDAGTVEPEFDLQFVDLAVLTQTCDIENGHVDQVLLVELISYEDLVKEQGEANPVVKSTEKFKKPLSEGAVNGLFLFPHRLAEPKLPWTIADFRKLHTLPKAYLSKRAKAMGTRLRLQPPYREALSQAFARFLMRVAFDEPLTSFYRQGKPAAIPAAEIQKMLGPPPE